MRTQDIVNKTADILIRYYNNEIQPFLDSCDKDILWIGPAEKQVIRGKQNLVDTFAKEEHELSFRLHNFTVFPVPTGSSRVCVAMAFFQVDTFWPDGSMNRVNQRIEFTWRQRGNEGKLSICHISNSIAYDERDTIYPVHYEETYHGIVLYGSGSGRSERISFKGPDRARNYLNWSSVLYAETFGGHAVIHATDQKDLPGGKIPLEGLFTYKLMQEMLLLSGKYFQRPVRIFSPGQVPDRIHRIHR